MTVWISRISTVRRACASGHRRPRPLAVIAGVARYEADDGSSSDAQSLNAEWSNKISETSQVFVRGGANRVKSDETGGTSTNTGFNGGAGVRWSFEVTQIFFDVNHYLDPSSYGRVVARDQLRFQLSRRLGPLTTLSLAARGIRDSDTGSDSTFRDRNYAVASVGLEWRMKRQWALGGGYDYRWRKFDGAVERCHGQCISSLASPTSLTGSESCQIIHDN